MCDPLPIFFINIYNKASPRKKASKQRFAAKHNATILMVKIYICDKILSMSKVCKKMKKMNHL